YEFGAGCLNTYAAVRMAGLGTPLGRFRNNLSDATISYSRDPIVQFNSAVTPGSTYSTKFNVPADAVFATVEVGWLQSGSAVSVLNATVSGPGKTVSLLAPSCLGLPALNKTGVTINDPAPGNWTISVTNVSDATTGASQRLVVAVALVKALGLDQDAQAASLINPGLADWNLIPAATRGYISIAVSRNLMPANAGYFRPTESITRLDLAASAVALQRTSR